MHIPSRAALLPLFLALAACVTEQTSVPAGPEIYHVTQERNGQTISLAVGQQLAVVLPSIAGSSSRWGAENLDTSILQQTSGTRTVGGSHGGMIIGGSKGYEKVLFRTLRAGQTRLRMVRVRTSSEGGGVSRFEIGIVVGGAGAAR